MKVTCSVCIAWMESDVWPLARIMFLLLLTLSLMIIKKKKNHCRQCLTRFPLSPCGPTKPCKKKLKITLVALVIWIFFPGWEYNILIWTTDIVTLYSLTENDWKSNWSPLKSKYSLTGMPWGPVGPGNPVSPFCACGEKGQEKSKVYIVLKLSSYFGIFSFRNTDTHSISLWSCWPWHTCWSY